jgi:hypothetical protein
VTDATAPERAVPSVGPIEYELLDAGEAAAHVVGDRLVPQRGAEDHRRHVGRPGQRERGEREWERVRQAEDDDRAPVAGCAHGDGLPVPVHAPHPAGGKRERGRADRHGGVQQPEQLRPAELVGHGREQRDRDAEQHGVDVDRIAADQLLP